VNGERHTVGLRRRRSRAGDVEFAARDRDLEAESKRIAP
jgi:hypothetical protein